MIYIKENNTYVKYHTGKDGRLICTHADGTESIILNEISSEFDGIIDEDKNLHFVLQGESGELIYLKKENDVWTKYRIFESLNGIKKIHGLTLKKSGGKLCAFYIMEHEGKQLMVKHRFSVENLYEEPEVLGITDMRRDFCICSGNEKEMYLFYKDANGERREHILDDGFNVAESDKHLFEKDTLSLRTCVINGSMFAVYTVSRKVSTALVFCNCNQMENKKIITFGISKSCIPEIISYDDEIIIQWEENGTIMQSQSKDMGISFSKPRSIGAACMLLRIRHMPGDETKIKCNRCAIYNSRPYISGKERTLNIKTNSAEVNTKMNNNYRNQKNDITNDQAGTLILEKLKNIENDIIAMGKSIYEICGFLDTLKNFKKNAETESFDEITIPDAKKDVLSGDDIGEIDSDNMKLFESTDIDTVLPDNQAQI